MPNARIRNLVFAAAAGGLSSTSVQGVPEKSPEVSPSCEVADQTSGPLDPRPCGFDLLYGEEDLHDQLQRELIAGLANSHDCWGLVVQIEAKFRKSGSFGMLRSIQAAPGCYSCELVELSTDSGTCLDSRYFTLVPPEEGASRASVIVLAKAAALIQNPDARPLVEGRFDAVARQCDALSY